MDTGAAERFRFKSIRSGSRRMGFRDAERDICEGEPSGAVCVVSASDWIATARPDDVNSKADLGTISLGNIFPPAMVEFGGIFLVDVNGFDSGLVEVVGAEVLALVLSYSFHCQGGVGKITGYITNT